MNVIVTVGVWAIAITVFAGIVVAIWHALTGH
jgi:hypothetical protein